MTQFPGGRRFLMGSAAGVVALAGALSPVLVSAQTPPAAGQRTAACTFSFGGDFAAQLAKALGKSQADVEKALAQVNAQFPPERVPAKDGGMLVLENPHDPKALGPAAAKLGVTAEELAAAIKAALPEPPAGKPGFQAATATAPTASATPIDVAPANLTPLTCDPPALPPGQAAQPVQSGQVTQAGQPGQALPAGGDVMVVVGVGLNEDTFFQTIAEKLGHGITAAQVKDALATLKPSGDVFTVSLLPGDQYIEALAKVLGVTVDQLKSALKSIMPAGGVSVGGR